jgi:hypothetical protein
MPFLVSEVVANRLRTRTRIRKSSFDAPPVVRSGFDGIEDTASSNFLAVLALTIEKS